MRKTLFTLAFSVFCLVSYAQSAFTEVTFMAMMNRLQTDATFFKNEADPSFTITFGSGGTSSQESMLKFAEKNIGLYKRNETNLKVSQVGGTGVVTGVVEERFMVKENPTVVRSTAKYLFTYTFSQVNGKWLWVSAQHTEVPDKTNSATFSETVWKAILEEFKNDSKAFFASRISEDFRYPLPNGTYLNKANVTAWDKSNILNTEMLEPLIFQSGDLAVISGKHITAHGVEKDKGPHTDKVAATYTFQRRNGKWMFVASQQNPIEEK